MLVKQLLEKTTLIHVCACVLSHFSDVQLLATLWTVAHQAPSSQTRDQTCFSYVSCTGRQVLYHQRHLGSPTLIHSVDQFPSSKYSSPWPIKLPTVEQPVCNVPENFTTGCHAPGGASGSPVANTNCRDPAICTCTMCS